MPTPRYRKSFRPRPATRGDMGSTAGARVRRGAGLAGQLRDMLLEKVDLQAGVQAFTDQDEPAYAHWIESNFGELRRENERLDEEVEDLTGALEEIRHRLAARMDGDPDQSAADIVDAVMERIEEDRVARENFKQEARRAAGAARRERQKQAVHDNEDSASYEPNGPPAGFGPESEHNPDVGMGLISALAAVAQSSSEMALHEGSGKDGDIDPIFGGNDEYAEMMFREFMYGIRGIDIDLMDNDEYQRARREFFESFQHAREGNLGDFEKAIRLAGADTSEENRKAVKTAYRRLVKRLHPDRNPHLAEDENAKRLWREAGTAHQSLDLSGLDRIELQCILNSGDEITPDLMPRLIDLREWLNERIDDLNEYFEHISHEPAFGFATAPLPAAGSTEDTREQLQFQVAALRSERSNLHAQIDHLRSEPIRRRRTRRHTPAATQQTHSTPPSTSPAGWPSPPKHTATPSPTPGPQRRSRSGKRNAGQMEFEL